MDFPATQKYSTPCGTQFDTLIDKSINAFSCESWARWEFQTLTGVYLYACSSHTDRVLGTLTHSDLSGVTYVSVKDLRTL